MQMVEQCIADWQASLVERISREALRQRNPIAYKWQGPFRCWILREAALWRITDLLTQSYSLHQQGYGLGARILLRSGFETLATTIYLNQLIQQVLDDELDFHLFANKTSILLLGSRNKSTGHQSLNIVSILQKCDKRYPGLERIYGDLSESAHPNYEGLLDGYSQVNHDEAETRFSNRWMDRYGESHLDLMTLCINTFDYEYNDVWVDRIHQLESWIMANDVTLAATK